MRLVLTAFFLSASAFAQTFDTSNNAALHGDYFIREVLITGQSANGAITSAKSAIGLATFNGKGAYQFTSSAGISASGGYGVGANGLMYMQSLVDSSQNAFGGLSAVGGATASGPQAFVASATEGSNADTIVAIPAGTLASTATLKGSYNAGYLAFPSAAVGNVREAALTLTADGAGNLTSVAVSGAALNLGGSTVSQTITGATYTLSGEGIGIVNFGGASATQILSGNLNFYVSADGNLFLAGTPGGYDLIFGIKALSAAATNATWSGLFFTTALEDAVANGAKPTHAIDAYYGSWNAANSGGSGVSIAHSRFQPLGAPFDYTFDSYWNVQANGTVSPTGVPYNITLGDGGQAYVGIGTSGLYSLTIGLAAPKFSGSGVFLNPAGVVNAANFAPMTNPIAPGELIALFGSGLAAAVVSAPALPLPTTLGGVQVTINGKAAPLVYVTPTQIVCQVPQSISPANNVANATIQVTNNNLKSNAVTVFTNYTAPGVFANGGVGFAAAQRANYSTINASNAANIGETIVLYATGLGATSPAVNDGVAAPSAAPLAATVDKDAVYFGGQAGKVVFSGLTPGLAGLFQLNTTVLVGTPIGVELADISTPDGYTSQATIATAAATGSARPAGPGALLKRPSGRIGGLPERAPR